MWSRNNPGPLVTMWGQISMLRSLCWGCGALIAGVLCGLLCLILPWPVVCVLVVLASIVAAVFGARGWALCVLMLCVTQIGQKDPAFQVTGLNANIPVILVIPLLIGPLLLVVRQVRHRDRTAQSKNLLIPIAFLVTYSCLTVFWNRDNVDQNLMYTFLLAANALTLLAAFEFADSPRMCRMIFWCLAASGLLLCVQVLLSPYIALKLSPVTITEGLSMDFSRKMDAGSRCSGIYLDPLQTSATLGCLAMVVFALLTMQKKFPGRVLLLALFILYVYAMGLTLSRVGAWGLFLMLNLFLIFTHRTKLGLALRMGAFNVLILALLFTASYVNENIMFPQLNASDRGIRVLTMDNDVTGGSLDNRLILWRAGFEELGNQSQEIIGLGAGGYLLHVQRLHAHNLYLGLLFDYGLIGVAFIVWLFVKLASAFFSGWGLRGEDRLIYAAGAALVLGIAFMSLTFLSHYFPFVWAMLGVGYAAMLSARGNATATGSAT